MSAPRAWSVGVLALSPHGQSLTSVFVMAETRAEAIAAGVRYAITHTNCPDANRDCLVNIAMTQATLIDREVIEAAATELGMTDKACPQ